MYTDASKIHTALNAQVQRQRRHMEELKCKTAFLSKRQCRSRDKGEDHDVSFIFN